MGVSGSVSFMYEHLGILRFKGLNEEEVLDSLINASVDVDDIETEEDITVYVAPTDLYSAKEALLSLNNNLEFIVDEITMLPKEKVTLSKEDKELFDRMYDMLDEIEDVQNIYHNVNE
jgi:transcriptional/translational regulatory protein YebC/TACO1